MPKAKACREDDGETVRWFRKAAEQNHSDAQYQLGCRLAKGQGVATNLVESVKWYRKAAEQNDARAQYNLGVCYTEDGLGVAKDYVEAYKWFVLSWANRFVQARGNMSLIELEMTREQIAEGQKRARQWQEKRDKTTSAR
jgi:uncharacterized protein